ncbi:histidine kinase [Hymenobacter sp. BT662]|uniref:histidine kinase n=2 Tax=Hymenobacter ruricola TaxID=2791023 RepID=A0ABS0HZS3_9BACT|nr:histidine kinase [Hymenobacter ruricola]
MGWVRLRFRPADSLRARALRLQVLGYGAWEVYLNGRLVQRSGTVRPNPSQVPAPEQLPAIEVPAGGPATQVLAIRFAPWQSGLLRLGTGNGNTARTLLQVRLRAEAQVRQQAAGQVVAALVSSAAAAVFGLLTLLHLAFFRYYPRQRANLYFAFFSLALALSGLTAVVQWGVAFPPLAVAVLLPFSQTLLFAVGYVWAVRALYALFGFRPGWVYKGLWGGVGALLVLGLSGATYLGNVLALLILVTIIELVRLTVRALRQRQRGAWIVGAGFAVILLVIVVLTLSALVSQLLRVPNPLQALSSGNWAVGLLFELSPALGISLFLAREFALDSQLLQVKLAEVERLSAQTLAQEQEKQALLAAQNETLEQQVQQRTSELQRSLTDLRATQAQLIQKEKMASLGELTAGIAHEIQNPLNFVNNFAEVSAELMAELEEAQAAHDAEEVTALAADVRQNLGKITEHGRRAAAIVRGMLEHSRQSTGERAPTDLNALCDEYLRLAYQGLRAKEKTFNATLQTDFAPGLPPVQAVAGDLGRVLLNLFGNAFYAVQKRQQTGEPGYAPTVTVSTQHTEGRVEIRVTDNGTGIPAGVLGKIFQPFFTTKPTGEGTGLGLSLSHDIIAQGHGGTLAVESREGEGTTFCVGLPLGAGA